MKYYDHQIEEVEICVYVALMEGMRDACKIFFGKPKGKRSPGKPRYRWKYIITTMLGNLGGRVWIGFIWLGIETCEWLL
jgi:hypothetical protein